MPRFAVIVDTQRDFIDPEGALSVAGADQIVQPMRDWLAGLDPAAYAGALFTFDTHDAATYAQTAEAQQFPPHCLRGTPGWDNVLGAAMLPEALPAWRIEKGVFDMWAEPDLMVEDARGRGEALPREAFFADLQARGVTEVDVIGVAADFCVRWAIAGLLDRGLAVRVPAALVRGIERPIDQVVAEEFGGQPVTLA